VNPELPSALDRIITKALEKDRDLRYQHASDIHTDLKRLQRDTSSDQQMIAGLVKRHGMATALVAAGIVIVAALIYALYRPARLAPVSPAGLEFTRVTGSGDVKQADISPDGVYVAYVRETGGKQSLWLRQLATDSDVQIASLGEDQCPGLAFSPDGSYVYFVRQVPGKPDGDLYQVPSLGGTPRKMLAGISGRPAFSADGQRVAFVRSTSAVEDSLLTASLDGSGERVLAAYKRPEGIYPYRVAWSPDGKTLDFLFEIRRTLPPSRRRAVRPGRWRGALGMVSRISSGSLEAVTWSWPAFCRGRRRAAHHRFSRSRLSEAKSARSLTTFRPTQESV
jgi:eukaryotic-like serine/threonine-protein kinase